MNRLNKHKYYLNIAKEISLRSTCLRRRYGAVVVKNDEIVSTGYNGSPRKVINCNDTNQCYRAANSIPAGQRYELCHSVHAEANAIISASRDRMIDSSLYLIGVDIDTNDLSKYNQPCSMCRRLIINAGIKEVIMMTPDGSIDVWDSSKFIEEENNMFKEVR